MSCVTYTKKKEKEGRKKYFKNRKNVCIEYFILVFFAFPIKQINRYPCHSKLA